MYMVISFGGKQKDRWKKGDVADFSFLYIELFKSRWFWGMILGEQQKKFK